MEIKNGRKVANKRNSFIPTKVRGVRAELSWWEMCESVAKIENTTVNEMIVREIAKHCEKYKPLLLEEQSKVSFEDYKVQVMECLKEMGISDRQIAIKMKDENQIHFCLSSNYKPQRCAELL